MDRYTLVVGNVGTVYDGDSLETAIKDFDEYVILSNDNHGRAGGEDVTLFKNDEILKEHQGFISYAWERMEQEFYTQEELKEEAKHFEND